MDLEQLFGQVTELAGPRARLVVAHEWPDRLCLSVIIHPYSNWCRGTLVGTKGQDFPEPIEGLWLVLKGESARRQAPFDGEEHVQAAHASGSTFQEAAEALLARLRELKAI